MSHLEAKLNSGRIIIIEGILIAKTKPLLMVLLPKNVYRERTYAAGAAMSNVPRQDVLAYIREFPKKIYIFCAFHAAA